MKVFKIRCGGRLHRIGYDGRSWVALDHDPGEYVAVELGLPPPKCIRFMKLINKGDMENVETALGRIGIGNKALVSQVARWMGKTETAAQAEMGGEDRVRKT